MLKKSERLSREAFDSFFKSGKRRNTPLLQIVYTKYPTFHGSIVVGKKVHKKAVDRNKTRRRLYNLLYSFKRQYGLTGVYIIITKPEASKATYNQLKDDLINLIGV